MPAVQIDELYVSKVMKYLKELEYTKYPNDDLDSNCSYDSCAKDLYDKDTKVDKKSSKSVSRGQSHQAYKDAEYAYNTIGCCSEKSYAKYGRSKKFSKSTSGKSRAHQANKGAEYTYKANDCCSVKSRKMGKGTALSTSGKSHRSRKDGEHTYNEIDCCSEKAYSTKSGKTGKAYSTKSGKTNKTSKTSKSQSHQGNKDAEYAYNCNDCCSVKGRGLSTSGKSNQAFGDAEYTYNGNDCCSEKGPPSYTPGNKGQSYYTTSIDKTNGNISRSRAGSTRSTKSDKSDNWQPIIKLMPDDIELITTKEKWCKNRWLLLLIILLTLLLAAALTALIVMLATGKFAKKGGAGENGDGTGTALGRIEDDGTCDCSEVVNRQNKGQGDDQGANINSGSTNGHGGDGSNTNGDGGGSDNYPGWPPVGGGGGEADTNTHPCPTPKPPKVWPVPDGGSGIIDSPDGHGKLVYPEGRPEKYLIVNEAVSWETALRKCNGHGGHLAVLESIDELEKLADELAKIPPLSRGGNSYNYYIGGIKVHNDGPFFWVTTGEQVNDLMWADGEPNHSGGEEFCVGLDPHRQKGKINDTRCNHGYEHLEGYVCELPDPRPDPS